MSDFSDFIVFADESGDHGMENIDPEFPMFALVFCVFRKSDYSQIATSRNTCKFDRCSYSWFPSPLPHLHAIDIPSAVGRDETTYTVFNSTSPNPLLPPIT